MYQVLIVDDEKMIRNGIRSMLPWERLGVGEVLTAGDGREALKLLEAHQPDLILTDIHMTEMDGLTMIERIRAVSPDIRILVLTGYDNFEYAQRCCRMQVQDFLLKPADEQTLTAAIDKQLRELDKACGDRHRQKMLSRAQGVSEQLRLEGAMQGLIHGRVKAQELEELYREYRYNPLQPMQAAVILPVLREDNRWKEHNDLLSLSIKNTCIQLFDARNQGITFVDDDGRIILAIFTGSEFDEVAERAEKLGGILRDEFDIGQKVTLGSPAEGFGELAISYNDAVQLLNEFREGLDEIVLSDSTQRRLKLFTEIFGELKHIMVSSTGDAQRVLKAFTTFENAVESYNLAGSYVCRCCFELACALYYTFLSDTGESADGRLVSLMHSLMVCGREEACKTTRAFLSQLFGGGTDESGEIVGKARQYITLHLSEELSVSSIAETLFVTPNYFSRLFKRTTGEGCNEYIVRQRMEKACSLLETTSAKTGKIALMVGYRDTNYFSLAFKKYAGVSPTVYRQQKQV